MIAAAMGPDGDLVAKRLARGCRCFAVWIDDSLAGYGWLSVDPEWIGELQLEIKPRSREGYIWNCVTIPRHRRRGVFRSLVAGIAAAARRSGLRRVWIGSVAIPAEKALGPLGFRPALHFDTTHVMGVLMVRVRRSTDPALASEGAGVTGARPGLMIRGSHHRRH